MLLTRGRICTALLHHRRCSWFAALDTSIAAVYTALSATREAKCVQQRVLGHVRCLPHTPSPVVGARNERARHKIDGVLECAQLNDTIDK